MDIALVVRRFGRRGGVARYTAELAERLAGDNTVTVYAAAWEEPHDSRIRFVRVPFLTSSFLGARRRHASNTLLELASFMWNAGRVVDRRRHDIVHDQGDAAGGGDVLTAHSCHKAWLRQARLGERGPIRRLKKTSVNPLHGLILRAERINVTRAVRVIAISGTVRRQIMEEYGIPGERIAVIPNGVDVEHFRPEGRPILGGEARRSLGIDLREIVAIFPAHEFRRKGLDVLLEALRRLPDGLSLLVVGRDDPAPYQAKAERYGIRGRIRFVGDTPDIRRFYAAADLMVLPTTFEAFGLVITEAMACGLPVVTSRGAGAAELMTHGVNGLLLDDPTDVAEVATTIKRLAEDAELRARIGGHARELAESCSWDRVAEMTSALYAEVVREKAAGMGRRTR